MLPIYVPEPRSSDADEILEHASSVAISDLTLAELRVSLIRRVKLGTLKPADEREIRSIFEKHLEEGALRRYSLTSEHYERAGLLAATSSVVIRTLDALHLAVASSIGATIATFDTRMAQAARSLDLGVVPPGEPGSG